MIYVPIVMAVIGLLFMAMKRAWVLKQDAGDGKMKEISDYIYEGALAFLKAEYRLLAVFVLISSIVLAWITFVPGVKTQINFGLNNLATKNGLTSNILLTENGQSISLRCVSDVPGKGRWRTTNYDVNEDTDTITVGLEGTISLNSSLGSVSNPQKSNVLLNCIDDLYIRTRQLNESGGFGYSVSVSEDVAIVGAPNGNKAYIYHNIDGVLEFKI